MDPVSSSSRHRQPLLAGYPRLWSSQLWPRSGSARHRPPPLRRTLAAPEYSAAAATAAGLQRR
eukprot:618606-Alexandrium_andersonii.AAC.1